MAARQDSDNLAWDRTDALWKDAVKHVQLTSTCRKIESFAERTFGQTATLIPPIIIGGFNVLYIVRVDVLSENVLVRLPCPNQAVFPAEKTLAEAATAAYISQHTQLRVPKILYHGVDSDIGPFMIIEELGSRRGMGQALEVPRKDLNNPAILQSDMPETKLKSLYAEMARCMLQLAQPEFSCIGALVEVEWYTALAEMQMATLVFQHNDVVSSEDDCRNKYVARQLFRRLAKQGQLSSFGFAEDNWSTYSKHTGPKLPSPDCSGSFRLWSDDFRPANVLVDNHDHVLGAIDWEFAYIAPTQFVLDSPWWLLLDTPEMWDAGIDDWSKIYEAKLDIWISAMQEAEQEMSPGSFVLSAYMRESWTTGRFWLNYAARKSWAFDAIYWKYLDERFFGEREDGIPTEEMWKTRVHLLSEEEQATMKPLVQAKMAEAKTRVLIEWDAEDAKKHISSFLLD
ncbi:unnamed protein product [Fusarium venenatum]|uniref:Aminoglycoside phosphotransferase domain-containing protein n=1 Tax=Fusarium venenatum TaxID=56646 RepID=A0A2L2SV06_9HYPO|nr:uncharacterized protein FVRRES_05808 [Fusarium venenatum]CEI61372.1 unnamed protein product [Fusarium venenatum]